MNIERYRARETEKEVGEINREIKDRESIVKLKIKGKNRE